MPIGKSKSIFTDCEPSSPHGYTPELQSLKESLLATLSNIDFEHELDLSKLNSNSINASLKRQISERLKERHRQRRGPYVQQLTGLEQRIGTITKG